MRFACFAVPGYLFSMPVHLVVEDDPRRRVLFSPRIEVNIDGMWLLDDAE